MSNFQYFMPTKVFCGKDIISKNKSLFGNYGKKAFIITGKNSSKINGSLEDVINALNESEIEYCIFNNVEENPSIETVETAVEIGRNEKVDFLIGIGGGSPIDAAKAIGILINNPEYNGYDIFTAPPLASLPLIAVPTTAGTGTEVTPYAILTDNKARTKRNFGQKVFPEIALLDASYLMNTPDNITINTAVDALSHLIEGYLSIKSNLLSDSAAEKGLLLFWECIDALKDKDFSFEIREKLLLSSTLGGIVIAQSGTSLPHGMGYALTYSKNIPHGKANGLLLKSYLELCGNNPKVKNILSILELNSLDKFGQFILNLVVKDCSVTEAEIRNYTKSMISNTSKLKNHPGEVTEKDIYEMYITSLL